MQNNTYHMLVNAAGHLMQEHAFDHLPDEKLNRLRQSFRRLASSKTSSSEKQKHGNELLNICSKADLFTETATQQSLQQWYTVMNCLGVSSNTAVIDESEV